MQCPKCQSQQTVKNGKQRLQDQSVVQNYLCKACSKQFNERTGTPMTQLRMPVSVVDWRLFRSSPEGRIPPMDAAQCGAKAWKSR